MRNGPIRHAANQTNEAMVELELTAREARVLLKRLSTDGLEFSLKIGERELPVKVTMKTPKVTK